MLLIYHVDKVVDPQYPGCLIWFIRILNRLWCIFGMHSVKIELNKQLCLFESNLWRDRRKNTKKHLTVRQALCCQFMEHIEELNSILQDCSTSKSAVHLHNKDIQLQSTAQWMTVHNSPLHHFTVQCITLLYSVVCYSTVKCSAFKGRAKQCQMIIVMI